MRFKTLRFMLPLVLLVALAVMPTYAATSLTATTLSVAANATQTTMTVASATDLTAGWIMYIDREAVLIRSISSTVAVVQRGVAGTAPAAHKSGAGVLAQTPSAFFSTDVSGTCSTITETYLPHINTVNGNVFDCYSSSVTSAAGVGNWVRYKIGGLTVPTFYGTGLVQAYTASGAVLVKPGFVTLAGGSAQSYTLVAPTVAQNGVVMTFIAITAQAHTLACAGWYASTTGTMTFAAINDTVTIVAINGKWYPIAFHGTSLGTS